MKKKTTENSVDAVEVKEGQVKVEEPATELKEAASSTFRDNPWIVSTIVLGVILVGFVIFSLSGKGITGDVISEESAANNLISFIKSRSQGVPPEVNIVSVERDGQLYKITIDYQGQNIPVYVSVDGKYLIADPIPLNQQMPLGANNQQESGGIVNVQIGDSPVKGDANAPVTIVEFSDFECPFCARFFEETLPLIRENYINTGKVKFVYKDFPLNIHENAQKAAEAARCVREQRGDDGFWLMHDKLYKNQDKLSLENFKKWAREIGVSGAKFDKCLEDGTYADEVKEDFEYGQELGVRGTPAFFINGKLVSGAQPYSVFEQMINAELGTASTSSSPAATATGSPTATPEIEVSPVA